ncbi:hypothetical protein SAMN04487934_10679 [Eubacterium ruminantium]|nr:hypothetical protein SAMN04487934_10679 [Eubacterium ruminantium]
MDSFSTYQGALDIFRKVNSVGERENCVFGAIVDFSKSSDVTPSMAGLGAFGAVGYVVGSVVGAERDERVRRINEFIFVLLDFNENGFGVMPLRGGGMKINPEKLTPCYDAFFYFYYQEVHSITVKNYMGIRKSVKSITIILNNGRKLNFTANMEEKTLPYQVNGMKTFVERYQR